MAKLEQERQRSDQLLYRMMPKAVADRLKDGQKAIETCEVLVCLCLQLAGNTLELNYQSERCPLVPSRSREIILSISWRLALFCVPGLISSF